MEPVHLPPSVLADPEQWSLQLLDDFYFNTPPVRPSWSPCTIELEQIPAMHTDLENQEQIIPSTVSTAHHPFIQTNNISTEENQLFHLLEDHSILSLGEDHLDLLHVAQTSSSSSSSNKPDDEFYAAQERTSPSKDSSSSGECKDSLVDKKTNRKRIQKNENKRLTEDGSEGKKSKKSAQPEKPRERGPKLAIRTRSEVDIIDDGYKWRKYGQKAVKNSQYARSYYRCTNTQCQVKKHVERYASDPEFVVTTYEGVHNHTGPALFQITNRPIFISQGTFPIPLDQLQMSASAALSLFGNSYDELMQAQASCGVESLWTRPPSIISQGSTISSDAARGGEGGLLEDVLPAELRPSVKTVVGI